MADALTSLRLAVQFLTRLPVGSTAALSPVQVRDGLRRAVGWFPLVGALVGCITAGAAIGAVQLFPPLVAALIALAVEARVTGAFHEDALADAADALGGGHDRASTLAIMKDSRVGSYGALALVLGVGLRAALIATLLGGDAWLAAAAIVAAATLGRLAIVALMRLAPALADREGLAKDIAAVPGGRLMAGACLAAVPGFLPLAALVPGRLLLALLLAAATMLVWSRLLNRRLGGSTGDCLGAGAYGAQLAATAAAAARLP